jgi:hypothetical protein
LVTPIYNGLSDHDAQLLTIRIKVYKNPIKELKTHRNFNKHTISEFINTLSNESWDMVFNNNNNKNEDVNDMFNSFLNNYIRLFNSSFPLQTGMSKKNFIKHKWIIEGIKISCSTKRNLYIFCRLHPNEETKRHYQLKKKILANVIKKKKKKTYYNKKILKSNNKSKTTWNIIKEISGHKQQKIDVQDIKIEHKYVTDPKEIACIFNNYFTFKNIKGNKDETESRQKNTSKNYYPNLNGIQHVPSLVFKTF